MASKITRRDFMKFGIAGGLALGAGAGAWPRQGHSQSVPRLTYTTLNTGFTVIINEYMAAKRFDLKHGVNLDVVNAYTNVGTYYNDFVAGNYDVCIGTWDTFAARYLAGVPIQLVSLATTANMINILTPANGPKTVKELAGKNVAAPQATGTYRLAKAMLSEFHGLDLEKAAKVQNVSNPAASMTLVMANRADAGLSWEPNISVALTKEPSLKLLYNVGSDYKANTGVDMPFFSIGIQKSAAAKTPGIAARVARAFDDCINAIKANPDEAVRLAAAKMEVPPEALKLALSSGRLAFEAGAMSNDKARKSVVQAGDFLVKTGLLPRKLDDGFFALS